MTPNAKAAAIYCRISQDRGGTALGVERQEALCRRLAEDKGWSVAEVYVDNDVSAYSGKPRPAYDRMLIDLRERARDAVVCVDLDRLTRRPAELEDFIVLADSCGIALANVSGDTDLSTTDGRFRARILGAVARQESEKKSDRIKRQREELATRGLPHPGPRAFGFEKDNMTLREREAALIREAAHDVLNGRSIRSVADRWNAAGVATAKGNRWTVDTVRAVLTSPRTAGLRKHKGEIIGEGKWPAILDRATWEQLTMQRKARRRGPGRPPTKLLSAIAVCGICGHGMVSSRSKGVPLYACQRRPGKAGACGRLSINADHLDAEIRDQLIAVLAGDGLAKAAAAYEDTDSRYRELAEELRQHEATLDELTNDYYVERVIDRGEFLRAREHIQGRVKAVRTAMQAATGRTLAADLPRDEGGLREWWDTAAGDARRAIVELFIQQVEIEPYDPAKPRRFDPDRAAVRWRI